VNRTPELKRKNTVEIWEHTNLLEEEQLKEELAREIMKARSRGWEGGVHTGG